MNYQAIRDFLTDFFKARLAEERLRVTEVGRMDEWRRIALRNTRDFSKDALETKCYLLEGTDESIDTLIEMNDLPLTKGTPQYEMLRTEYLKALPAYVRNMFAIDAEYEEYDFSSEPAAKQAAPSKPSRKAVPLGRAIQEYTEEKLRLKQWRSSTVLDYQGKFDLLVEYLGEDADAEITDDAALEIKQMLLRLPARRKTIPALEKLSIVEQMEASASYARLSPSSVNQYIQAYSGFYGWLKKRKQVTSNPFKDLIDDTSKTKQQREEFTLEQVQAIIKIALDTKKAYRKWGVLIAAYTGARLNEISQLDVADVIEEGGVPCISFTDEGDDNKRLKNAASKRIVPIHSQLIDYGFLEYVKQRKEENSPNTKLFKELSYDPKNGYGRALGRWVREEVLDKQLGIKGKGTVFHSFRNTVVTFLRNAGVSACATPSGQNQYQSSEVGVSTMVEFATVLHAREIGITGKNSGAGSLAGGALGATAASSAGGGTGQLAAVIGGAVVGAVAGHAAEQALADSVGMEYTVITESGKTMTVAQNHNKGDRLLQKGERVMIQTSGSYQRVLPAEQLPETVKRPKGVKIVD